MKSINMIKENEVIVKEIKITSDKETEIRKIVDEMLRDFMNKFEKKYIRQVSKANGIINMKKNNCFVAPLGKEFMFYSAFVRSFDSSLGKVLECIANRIACLTYEVRTEIDGYLLPQQSQHIDFLMSEYKNYGKTPQISDYNGFQAVPQSNIESYRMVGKTDNYFYSPELKKHYLAELKAGGDLDNKKAKAEKISLLQQYFLLSNALVGSDETIEIIFGTAYNKFGEGNEWKQDRVKQFFADEELLIGKEYWNFCCGCENGYDIVIEQYQENAIKLIELFDRIKKLYFN